MSAESDTENCEETADVGYLSTSTSAAPVVAARALAMGIGHRWLSDDTMFGMLMRSGPVVAKLGQWAAQNENIPENLRRAFKRAQNRIPESPGDKERTVALLGEYAEKVESDEGGRPILRFVGGATVSVVYKATLRETRREVAIKVIRKGVEEILQKDCESASTSLANVCYLMGTLGLASAADTVDIHQVCECLKGQTDMEKEYSHLAILRQEFEGVEGVSIPEPLYFGKDVLVMQFEEGIVFDDFVEEHPELKEEAEICAVEAYLRMVLLHKHVHIDYHGGNILFRKTGDGVHVVILDAGCVVPVNERVRAAFRTVEDAIENRDGKVVTAQILSLADQRVIQETIGADDIADLEARVQEALDEPDQSLTHSRIRYVFTDTTLGMDPQVLQMIIGHFMVTTDRLVHKEALRRMTEKRPQHTP